MNVCSMSGDNIFDKQIIRLTIELKVFKAL
jgi:hypothetical protein